MLKNLELNEPVKSSEFTGSNDPIVIGSGKPDVVISISDTTLNKDEVEVERRKVIELSNESILHGYDLAMQLLAKYGMVDAVEALGKHRADIEVGLHNGISERIEGNV